MPEIQTFLVHGQDDGLLCPRCDVSVFLESVDPIPSRAWRSTQTTSYRCHSCGGVLDLRMTLDEYGMMRDTWRTYRVGVPLPRGEEA
jgi:DNA-directed RNA polymerase subunit RPC12/RpoP